VCPVYPEPGNAICWYMRVYTERTLKYRIETRTLFASNNISIWLVRSYWAYESFSHVGYNTRQVCTHNCRRKRFSAYLKIHNTYYIICLHNIFYSCMSRAAFVPKRPVNLFPIVFRAYIFVDKRPYFHSPRCSV